LRGPGGCPWDRAQTPGTIRSFIIEEAHEIVEAIDSGDPGHLKEELGDVLFHVFLLAGMSEEAGHFGIGDVAAGITEKLVRRHPHVFGGDKAADPAEVESLWEKMKSAEKGGRKSIGDGIPSTVPALTRALRIGERAARTGFDWDDVGGILDKLEEEIREFKAELLGAGRHGRGKPAPAAERLEHEMGDVLFVITNLARHTGTDPEMALKACCVRFCSRFDAMKVMVEREGKTLEKMPLAELDRYWERAKSLLRK
jgi:MazG family protein